METVTMWIRGVLTALLLGLTVWWLANVSGEISSVPQLGSDGKVVLDEFQRSKDILLAVLPLLTTALGYWFGAAGKAKAEDKADKAQEQLKGVLASSSDTQLLEKAKQQYPDAFGN